MFELLLKVDVNEKIPVYYANPLPMKTKVA